MVKTKKKMFDCRRDHGLVFLIFRNETKRALLPNEITSIDTIRALFVRAFPDQLSMPWFEGAGAGANTRRRIYVMDPATNVYYELDDMREVKDRAVLKIYETEGGGGSNGSPLHSPKPRYHSGPGYESDGSIRSAPSGLPRSPVHLPPRPYSQEVASKTASLPAQTSYMYQPVTGQPQPIYGQHTIPGPPPQAAPGQPWGSPTTAHRPHSQYNPSVRSNQASPVRSPSHGPTQRHSVGYMPRASEIYAPLDNNGGAGGVRINSGYYDYPDTRSSGSVTPTMESVEQRHRMEKMEAQLANLTSLVQTAVMTKDGQVVTGSAALVNSRPPSARSNSSLTSDPVNTSNKSRVDSFVDVTEDPPESRPAEETTENRGLSDLSSATPQPIITVEMHRSLLSLRQRARELRSEAGRIRRAQMANTETMRETVHDTFMKIKGVLEANPALSDLPVRHQRQTVNQDVQTYRTDSAHTLNNLHDLEAAVEELRTDVVNKRCRVNQNEVETMALTLSNISKSLADMKGKFPDVQESMKTVMAGEMEIVVKEEKLASVQETRTPQVPRLPPPPEHTPDKRPLMDNIQSLVPDHEARLTGIEAAESSRERKKKISSNADALRFEKTLELAQRQLKETNNIAQAEQRQEAMIRQQIYNNNNTADDTENSTEVNIPLTDTTKKLSLVSQSLGNDNVIKKDSPKSPTKRVPAPALASKPVSPVKSPPPPPPAKPPRAYDHNVDGRNGDIMIVKSPVVVEQAAVGIADSISAPLPGPCLSTFAVSSDPPATPQRPTSGSKAPMSLATSTPKNNSTHVSFSNTVTEIPDNAVAMSPSSSTSSDSSGSTTSSTKPKKVPPPPPPRKSSRNNPATTQMTTTRPPSPPAYENIDSLKQRTQEKQVTEAAAASPKAFRPLSKYQQELASGIYSNMNRPDLQDQNVRPANIVRSPEHTAKHRPAELAQADGSDTDSSTSAEIIQISGTVKKRRTPTSSKENSPSPSSSSSNNGATTKDIKKVPPPPPVRKTSALTDGVKNGKEDVLKVGNGDVVNMGNGDVVNNKLAAARPIDPRSLSPASLRRYEETEIY